MTINYVEKGHWLPDEIGRQGYHLTQRDGTHVSTDDVAVQAIIDSFDPLPNAKADKIAELNLEAGKRVDDIYGFLPGDRENTNPKDVQGFYDFVIDIVGMIPSPNPITGRLAELKAVRDVMQATKGQINAQTDWQAIMAYDVVNTPSWP